MWNDFFSDGWDSVREMDKESICMENPGVAGPGCRGGAGRLVEWTGRAGGEDGIERNPSP